MDPREKVAGPAIGLMATAGIGFLFQVLGILLNVLGVGLGSTLGGQEAIVNMFSGVIGIIGGLIGIAMSVVVFFGALKMKSLGSYGFAIAASIVAMVPCVSPCCLLGLPIGIWALVVLLNQEVKDAFQKQQAG
jgi:hypothetical protein